MQCYAIIKFLQVAQLELVGICSELRVRNARARRTHGKCGYNIAGSDGGGEYIGGYGSSSGGSGG